jgi:glycosyltransferase involved in cell wall biosynthesis
MVSVILPVYNGEEFLVDAIASIQQQDYRPLEIILVDDGSTDQTARIAVDFQADVHYVYQSNSGPASARNRGLTLAQGHFVAFLDADDLWPTNKLRFQIDFLNAHPQVEIALGRVQCMHLMRTNHSKPEFKPFREPAVIFNVGAAVIRKSVFNRVGYFDESMRYSEDVDWFMRVRESDIPLVILDDVGLFYRIHEHNMTLNREISMFTFKTALKKSIDRRREQGSRLATSLPQLTHVVEQPGQPQALLPLKAWRGR